MAKDTTKVGQMLDNQELDVERGELESLLDAYDPGTSTFPVRVVNCNQNGADSFVEFHFRPLKGFSEKMEIAKEARTWIDEQSKIHPKKQKEDPLTRYGLLTIDEAELAVRIFRTYVPKQGENPISKETCIRIVKRTPMLALQLYNGLEVGQTPILGRIAFQAAENEKKDS